MMKRSSRVFTVGRCLEGVTLWAILYQRELIPRPCCPRGGPEWEEKIGRAAAPSRLLMLGACGRGARAFLQRLRRVLPDLSRELEQRVAGVQRGIHELDV